MHKVHFIFFVIYMVYCKTMNQGLWAGNNKFILKKKKKKKKASHLNKFFLKVPSQLQQPYFALFFGVNYCIFNVLPFVILAEL